MRTAPTKRDSGSANRLLLVVWAAMCLTEPAAAAETTAIDKKLNPLAQFDAKSLRGFIERPLFSPSRQSLAPPPPPVAIAEPPPPSELRLLGITRSGSRLTARIFDAADGKSYPMSEGEDFRDFEVKTIDDYSVTLAQGGKSLELRLFSAVAQPMSDAIAPTEPAVNLPPAREAVRTIEGPTTVPAPASQSDFTSQDLKGVFGDGPRDVKK